MKEIIFMTRAVCLDLWAGDEVSPRTWDVVVHSKCLSLGEVLKLAFIFNGLLMLKCDTPLSVNDAIMVSDALGEW